MCNFNKLANDLRNYATARQTTNLIKRADPWRSTPSGIYLPNNPTNFPYTTQKPGWRTSLSNFFSRNTATKSPSPHAQKPGWGASLVNFMVGDSPETNQLRQQVRDRDRQLADMTGKYNVLDKYTKTLKNKAATGGGTWYGNFLNTRLGGKASPTIGKFVSKNPMVGAAGILGAGMLGYGALNAGGNIISSMFGRGNQRQQNPYVRPYF